MLSEGYYADRPERRYLTFEPPRAGPDPMPCAPGEGVHVAGQLTRACGGEDPHHGLPPKPIGKEIYWQEGLKRSVRLRANVELMARQVHALRDAMAIARVLNRTLIIPHFECLCDRSGAARTPLTARAHSHSSYPVPQQATHQMHPRSCVPPPKRTCAAEASAANACATTACTANACAEKLRMLVTWP